MAIRQKWVDDEIMSKQFVLISLTILVWLLTSENVHSHSIPTGWYIATHGNNQNDCKTPKTPCVDVGTILNQPDFVPNDTILAEGANFYYTGEEEVAITIDKDVIISGGWSADFTQPLTRPTSFIGYEHIGVQIESNITVRLDHVVATGGEYNPSLLTTNEEIYIKKNNKGGIVNYGSLILNEGYVYGYYGFGIKNLGVMTFINSTVSAFKDTAIYNEGSLILDNTRIESTRTDVGCAGISNSGTLRMENSLIYNNHSRYGNGGLCTSGSALIYDSAIVDNVSLDPVPYAGGGIVNYGELQLTNSIVSGNYGHTGDLYNGGTVYLANSTINLPIGSTSVTNIPEGTVQSRNSIVSGCTGIIQSDGYNLLADSEGCEWQISVGDILDRDPLLDANLVPRTNSPALNAGNPAGCLAWDGTPLDTDGYGNLRWRECDMGAYEYIPPSGEIYYQHLPLINHTTS